MNKKVIIFDLDNTIIDRQRAFKEMLQVKLLEALPEDKKQLIDAAVQDMMEWDKCGMVERNITFGMFCEKYDVTSTTPKELCEEWSKNSGKVVYLFDDVIETLEYLHKKYRLALLTNGNSSSQRRKLQSTGIESYFEYTIVSSELGIAKPNPAPFLHVASTMHVNVEDCLYIGDNYNIDVIGSKNAHMDCIYVNRLHDVHEDVISINNLIELKEIL